jgi:hypothetical protein
MRRIGLHRLIFWADELKVCMRPDPVNHIGFTLIRQKRILTQQLLHGFILCLPRSRILRVLPERLVQRSDRLFQGFTGCSKV